MMSFATLSTAYRARLSGARPVATLRVPLLVVGVSVCLSRTHQSPARCFIHYIARTDTPQETHQKHARSKLQFK